MRTERRHYARRCLVRGLFCGLLAVPFTTNAQGLDSRLEDTRYVLSGWGSGLSGNQLIQYLIHRAAADRSADSFSSRVHAPIRTLPMNPAPLRRIKNSLGLDYALGAEGGLHLDAYCRRNIKGEGLRASLGREQTSDKRWSLGAALQPVRTEDGQRFISLVPQLLVNPDGAHSPVQHWKFSVEYGYWFGASSNRAAVAERVIQASVAAVF